eukprot:CAMPEP_0182468700 /NCGR_PEP_ID=MMETSP1319-20130603/15903_1 /TAXON_ID=172717 /ORGANISM="Bolidomonas pacifica, Strain RCC208" /LENGTH=166 /DNA_ID=CAMNT_0024668925 /DNA_START=600 /DNA_END=1096 /DNA_ORIENTATION=+
MGRKKRKATSPPNVGGVPPPPPPPPPTFGSSANNKGNATATNDGAPTTFLVRKYKFDATEFRTIMKFVDYVKNQRMLDASFLPSPTGSNPHRPYSYHVTIAGTPLGHGRGRSRDAAVENACRASFHVLSAPGWQDVELNIDCSLGAFPPEPANMAPPPQQPPPPPP